jgi:hypothetical protein
LIGIFNLTRDTMEQEILEKFRKEFPCIQSDCDGSGNIPHQVAEGEWEAQQCEFHAKYLFPLEKFISQVLIDEKEAWIEGERCRSCGGEKDTNLTDLCANCLETL